MKMLPLTAMFLAAILFAANLVAPPLGQAQAQAAAVSPAPSAKAMPQFDVATIKPPDPKARYRPAGFYGYPGGRVFFGGSVKMLLPDAFGLQQYQVVGGPAWAQSEWFEINALPPDTSPSRTLAIRTAVPTAEQRQMLQSLLRDRFGLKCHMESKEGEVYILSRGSKDLQLKAPKDPTMDPRAIVAMKPGGIVDGEAEGTNTTTDYLAVRLSRYLELPVLNRTGISGAYDFDLPPTDPENKEMDSAVISVVDRLGLKIKRSRGPVQTLVIDQVDHPNAN